MRGLTLDAGALIAIERGDIPVLGLIDHAIAREEPVHVVPEVVAQAWRGGPRGARLARFLNQREVTVTAYDGRTARAVGELAALSGHHDVVDVHVVLHARLHRHAVVTTDPDDLRAVDPRLPLIVV
jgi:hypothetical protein